MILASSIWTRPDAQASSLVTEPFRPAQSKKVCVALPLPSTDSEGIDISRIARGGPRDDFNSESCDDRRRSLHVAWTTVPRGLLAAEGHPSAH